MPESGLSRELRLRKGPVIPVPLSLPDAESNPFFDPDRDELSRIAADPGEFAMQVADEDIIEPTATGRLISEPIADQRSDDGHVPKVERVQVPDDFRPTVEVRADPEMLAALGIDPHVMQHTALQEGSRTRPERAKTPAELLDMTG